ncbi:uncharacterized protein K02A2.6-like [Eupeodes corollae]|uniref:uncharacterized protein K02A2.6-like n=1 Tax=Eupeodes corollae TaxID=290404 RepID=UPI00248FEB8F|nr:uncharacterized protein K02A2.6-like [Eupeodes corollae]
MASCTATNTINALKTVFTLKGLPKTIVSDNGTQFTSSEFQHFCNRFSIQHITSAPFNPESNGAAERMVRTFKTSIAKILCDNTRCEDALQVFLATYRSSPGNDGKSPAEKLHGRCHRTALSALCPDSKTHVKEKSAKFASGETVFVRIYRHEPKWIKAVILETLGRRMYRVETEYGSIWRRHQNQIRQREACENDHQTSKVQGSKEFTLTNPISYSYLGVSQPSQSKKKSHQVEDNPPCEASFSSSPKTVEDSVIEKNPTSPPSTDLTSPVCSSPTLSTSTEADKAEPAST